jgi:hypothetical protein
MQRNKHLHLYLLTPWSWVPVWEADQFSQLSLTAKMKVITASKLITSIYKTLDCHKPKDITNVILSYPKPELHKLQRWTVIQSQWQVSASRSNRAVSSLVNATEQKSKSLHRHRLYRDFYWYLSNPPERFLAQCLKLRQGRFFPQLLPTIRQSSSYRSVLCDLRSWYPPAQCHHMSLMDLVVSPPGCGRIVTDFWDWDAHEAQLRCPDEVDGDIWIWSTRRGLT